MRADPTIYENYAVAHRLGIGVLQPLTCVDDMPIDEYNGWAAYLTIANEPRQEPIREQTPEEQMAILMAAGRGGGLS